MASFPTSVKTFTTLVDLTDSVLASHQNERGDEITAIETALIDAIGFVGRMHTMIDGMKLTWNSATSITVGVGSCYAENGDWIDATSAITKSSLSLSASTWYHVYVYLSGGSPAAEVVTTSPAAWKGTAYSKNGATSRRYVGSILTDGSSNVYRFVHQPIAGRMVWAATNQTASPFRVLSAGTATTGTAVSVSGACPATATFALLQGFNTADGILRIGHTSSVSATSFVSFVAIGNSVNQACLAEVPISSANIYYALDSRSTGGAYLDIYGFVFDR